MASLRFVLPLLSMLIPGISRAQQPCAEWIDPHANTVEVSTASELAAAVRNAAPGTTVLAAAGTYKLDATLQFTRADVTLRSKTGKREDVILDGNQGGVPLDPAEFMNEIIAVSASGVVIADVTIRYARHHDIHAYAPASGGIARLLLRNLHVYDAGEQLIKVNSNGLTPPAWVDSSVLECSRIEFRDNSVMEAQGEGFYTGGLDLHGGRGWTVRGNLFRNIQREGKLMEHAVHMWSKSRGAVIEGNRFKDVVRAIGLGMKTAATTLERRYPDGKGDAPYFDFLEGVVRNNVIWNRAGVHLESGIELMNVLDVAVYHNTIVSADKPFTSIEYRWPNTRVELKNNLVSHNIMARDGAQATAGTNVVNAAPSLFRDGAAGDLHLSDEAASAIDKGEPLAAGLAPLDCDGKGRDGKPDIGAYESGAGNISIRKARHPGSRGPENGADRAIRAICACIRFGKDRTYLANGARLTTENGGPLQP